MAWKERQILTAYQTAKRKTEKYVKEIERQYGYCADPNLPCWKNVENYMLQMYAYLICARTMALVMAQHMANVNAKKTISDFIVNTMVGIMIKCLIDYDE